MPVGSIQGSSLSDPISNMTKQELSRFVQQAITDQPLPPAVRLNQVETADLLNVSGDIELSDQAVATLKKYLGL